MKKICALISTGILFSAIAFTQNKPAPFEGTIEFTQFNGMDTSYYKYYVKGNNIRLDNYDPKTKNVEGIYLIDLSTKKMTALSPGRKIYFDQPAGAPAKPAGTPKVTKTTNTKVINGYTCTEYDVVDADENTKIAYWIAPGHFDFFDAMLQVLNRKDKASEYFQVITNTQGMFPMYSSEQDLSGKKKGELKAITVVKAPQSADLFKIPADYKEFKK
jgi:hypothetical protein